MMSCLPGQLVQNEQLRAQHTRVLRGDKVCGKVARAEREAGAECSLRQCRPVVIGHGRSTSLLDSINYFRLPRPRSALQTASVCPTISQEHAREPWR